MKKKIQNYWNSKEYRFDDKYGFLNLTLIKHY